MVIFNPHRCSKTNINVDFTVHFESKPSAGLLCSWVLVSLWTKKLQVVLSPGFWLGYVFRHWSKKPELWPSGWIGRLSRCPWKKTGKDHGNWITTLELHAPLRLLLRFSPRVKSVEAEEQNLSIPKCFYRQANPSARTDLRLKNLHSYPLVKTQQKSLMFSVKHPETLVPYR